MTDFPERHINPFLAGIERTPETEPLPPELIRLDRNEHVRPLPQAVVDAVLAGVTPALLSEYPNLWHFSRRLAGRLGVAVDQLLLVPGSDAAIRSICHVLVSAGDRVAMLDPSYAMFPVYTEMFGGTPARVRVANDLSVDSHALRQACRDSKLLFLANPNQPTGSLIAPGEVIELARWAAVTRAIVVVDEAYYPFSGATVLPEAMNLPNVLVLRTFSKAYGLAGLRLGFLVGPAPLVRALYKVRHAYDINSFVAHVAGYLLDHEEIVDRFVAEVARGASLLQGLARDYGLEAPPTHANFQLIKTGPRWSPREVADRLRQRGYVVKGPPGDGVVRDYVRVTLGDLETIRSFAGCLSEVLESMGATRVRR